MLKKKNLILLSSLGAALLVTGCGNHKKNENVATAMQLVEELSYEDALASFDEALLNGEDKELIYRGEGLAYMGLSEYQDAVECFLKAFQYCNGRTGALEYDMNYYLATSYAKLEQYDQAEAVYTSILDMKPKSIDALYLRGCVRLKQNSKDAAVTDFEKAMSLKSDDIDLIVDVYQALAAEGYADEGAVYLRDIMDKQGKKMDDFSLGKINFYLGDYENARIHLDSALNGTDAEAILLLGQTYEALGDLNYAAVVYNTYLEKGTPDVQILNRLGVCKMKQENYEDALKAFEDAIAIQPNSIIRTVKFNEIVANEYLGRFDVAKSLMSDYLNNYPDDSAAKRENEFLMTR